MKFLFIFSFIISSSVFAGLFNPDHKFQEDPSCVIKGTAKTVWGITNVNRPIRCAIHEKKKELNFCEGDEVTTQKGLRMGHQVFIILDKRGKLYAYAPSNASKVAELFTDKVEQVFPAPNCKIRLEFLQKYIFEIGDREKLNHK